TDFKSLAETGANGWFKSFRGQASRKKWKSRTSGFLGVRSDQHGLPPREIMSWRTWRGVIVARQGARVLGVTRLLSQVVKKQDYERQFRKQMIDIVRPGDVVWDVGANVGYYSRMFSDLVGPTGHVVAWEPSPLN